METVCSYYNNFFDRLCFSLIHILHSVCYETNVKHMYTQCGVIDEHASGCLYLLCLCTHIPQPSMSVYKYLSWGCGSAGNIRHRGWLFFGGNEALTCSRKTVTGGDGFLQSEQKCLMNDTFDCITWFILRYIYNVN